MYELTAYIKPTNYCNVDCDHCYLPIEVRQQKLAMDDAMLKRTFQFILETARKLNPEFIHLIWHGGEPMMLPPEYYENALSIADDVFGDGKYMTSMQTSLMPYSAKWNDVISNRFGNFLGTSIDFSARSLKGSSDDYVSVWLNRVNKARGSDIEVVPGMVPSKNECKNGAKIVDWFIEQNFIRFNFERYTVFNRTPEINYPSNREHSKFMIDVFTRILEQHQQGNLIQAQPITAGIYGVLYNKSGDRWGTSCQNDFIIVEPDGSLNTCPDRANVEEPFGNVSGSAIEFITSPKRREWLRNANINHKKNHCHTCEYRTWCKSGCPITPNGIDEGESECSGFKLFLNHIKEFVETPENKAKLMAYLEDAHNARH
ncbi:radical SAM protein [Vibrio splendidus]